MHGLHRAGHRPRPAARGDGGRVHRPGRPALAGRRRRRGRVRSGRISRPAGARSLVAITRGHDIEKKRKYIRRGGCVHYVVTAHQTPTARGAGRLPGGNPMRSIDLRLLLTAGASALAMAGAAQAQEAQEAPIATAPQEPEAVLDDIIVVGSQIRGARVNDALPVTVLEAEDLDGVAATNGDELFRAIPQAADVAFNESNDVGGINDARGDTASINLRGLGTGNTLMLLNGRRMVLHPGTQT